MIKRRDSVRKLSARDLGLASSSGCDGATTVAGTLALALRAGIEVMATGGIGGVHLGWKDSFDESADLHALANAPCLVVCSGVKSVLDVAATLERLETLGVPVVGYRTETMPLFYLGSSDHHLAWSVDAPERAATAFDLHRTLVGSGMLLVQPVPANEAMDPSTHASLLGEAMRDARAARVAGADVTPFLLDHFARATGGTSVRTNVALVRSNAELAARIAVTRATRRGIADTH